MPHVAKEKTVTLFLARTGTRLHNKGYSLHKLFRNVQWWAKDDLCGLAPDSVELTLWNYSLE